MHADGIDVRVLAIYRRWDLAMSVSYMGDGEGGLKMGCSSSGVEGALKDHLCALARRRLVTLGVSQHRDGGDG